MLNQPVNQNPVILHSSTGFPICRHTQERK